eukprot:GCRY01004281.1.p1 GENE.GCRY01004281.1~~GCRY01004281.1.p1  ORF type:complete len:239 (+),score=27.87 GCRY01004281.1:54-719(+)
MDYLNYSGSIDLILGPMFSGKSTELIRRIRRFTIANRKCVIVKYAKDSRYSKENMATHDLITHKAVSASNLFDVKHICVDYDVIGVDEGQFYPDCVKFCEEMANLGKTVVVAALDGTFQRKGFGNFLELIPLAENITKLKSICQICYADAAFSKRTVASTAVEVIGGAESYIACCRKCFNLGHTTPAPKSAVVKSVDVNPHERALQDLTPKLSNAHLGRAL